MVKFLQAQSHTQNRQIANMSEAHGGVRFFPFSQEVLAALRRLMDFSDSDGLEIWKGQVYEVYEVEY